MADSTQGDTDVLYMGLLIPALIALIAGLVIHSFIIGVNVTDWWKGRSVTPVDNILTFLGISRMCAQCAYTAYLFVDTFIRNNLYSHSSLVIMDTVYAFFIYASIWLTSLLSIDLCLKIFNFHTRLFLYLRGVIAHRTIYLIVAAVLISAFNSLIHLLLTINQVPYRGIYNTTRDNLVMDCTYHNLIYSFTIGTFFPLFFYYISSALLFSSLYHHITKMKIM
ncbi:hypothetical protein GDO78_019095 [Eleutherodactylus coqui]|uniref:Taste receptor type 2 member 40 n=1 Tax=Eleutherodactylus coqui TaxID=57060 RepID=A0A8J6BD35_ELECQ|nr:hypothetical protein GDO78_019095 [Eleutherodactylus coqui]